MKYPLTKREKKVYTLSVEAYLRYTLLSKIFVSVVFVASWMDFGWSYDLTLFRITAEC